MRSFSQNQLTISGVWLAALDLYRKTFSKTWILGALIGIITTIFLWTVKFYSNGILTEVSTFGFFRERVFILLLALLIKSLVALYLTSLLLYQIYNIATEQNLSLKVIIDLVNKKYFTLAASTLAVVCLTCFGLLLLVLPGLFASMLFVAVQPLVLFDNHSAFAALKESCSLVWGKWWRTAIIFLPLFLLMFLAKFLVDFVVGYLFSKQIWYAIVPNSLLEILFYPLSYSCLLAVFNDLKLRKNNPAVATTT